MDEPLVVPGHPVDNPPTDDFWPHLNNALEPVFQPDDGTPTGPYQAKDAKWFALTSDPHPLNDAPMIRDPLIAITDSRVMALGRVGEESPPDRRLITQFRLVCCAAVEWEISRALAPSMLILTGVLGGDQSVGASLVLRFSKVTDVRSLAQELLHRTARQYLRLDLVDPDERVDREQTEKEYLGELAHARIDTSEREITVPFPRFRMINHGEDYRAGGPEIRRHMAHADLTAN